MLDQDRSIEGEPYRWQRIKKAFADAKDLGDLDRAKFLRGLSPDLRVSVERLIAADETAGAFMETPFAMEHGLARNGSEISERTEIDGYRLIDVIGSGGMGTVYLAEQSGESFSHRVALKLIKRGMDTEAVLKRFLMERQILANLEHPNIARMLDGGSTPDGLPYFVMEYVKGRSIRAYCDAEGLDVRRRLGIFVKACTAVSYAHRNLVVHRDLKPSNILVSEDGEPKLLDFGIAKVLQPDWNAESDAATATQFRVLTPEYASPEQILGEATSTLTDVYSLGVILYELLTGVRPFRSVGNHPLAIVEAISTLDPRKPSVAVASTIGPSTRKHDGLTVTASEPKTDQSAAVASNDAFIIDPRALRGDLDNIIMKAIRREPERRYQSVQELLEDVERYLKGLPVKATADSFSYRFGKFIKRHRVAVTSAAVAVAALAGLASLAGYQYGQANWERSKAEARFVEGRRYASSILFDHYERIKDLPGATEAKAKLIDETIRYLDAVSQDSGGDPDFQREMVKAYLKLAEIQGMTNGIGDLGDQNAAFESIRKGLAIQEQLAAADPSNVADQRQLAQLLSNQTIIADLSIADRDKFSVRLFEIYKRLREINPDKEQAESDYARGLWDRAHAVRRNGDTQGAIDRFTEAALIYETLYNKGAGNKRFRRSASLTYKNLGSVYRYSGNGALARECYEKALRYDREIIAETPDSVEARLGISFSHRGLGEALNLLKEFDRAISEFQEAISIQENIIANDPKNAFAADNLRDSYSGIAIAFREKNAFPESEGFFRKALKLDSGRIRAHADTLQRLYNASIRMEFAELLMKRAKGAENSDLQEARSELQTALQIFETSSLEGNLDPAMAGAFERTKELLANIQRS